MKFTEAAFRALEHEMIAFVSEHHKNQTYGGDKPYTYHLRQVRDTCYRYMPYLPYGQGIEVIVLAAWGHDLIEDCGVTREEIASRFGEEVAELIDLMSNVGPGSRKDRAAGYYQKIRTSVSAVYLKLMDRIANIEAGGKVKMYREEHLVFKAGMYKAGEMDPIWNELDLLLAA